MVPSPKLEWVTKMETNVHSSSGDDDPAAMSVAPATSSGMPWRLARTSIAGTRRSSVTMPWAQREMEATAACRRQDDDGLMMVA
jgi:hypothetical protein